MSFMARAGFEVNEVMAASPHVLDLASAAGMELAETANIVSQVIRGMGLEATEAQRVTDVLGLTAARTNTSVSQLGQAFGYVAPVAHALGITLEQTAAMLGMLSNAGIQADRAGTGLKNIFAELAAEIDENGISALEKFTKGGIGVAEAFDIFQKRGGPAILALESMAMRTDELIAVLQLAEGTIKRMNDIRMDTIEGAWKLVKSAVSDLQIEMAEKLEPTIRNIEESLRQVAVASTIAFAAMFDDSTGALASVGQLNAALLDTVTAIFWIIKWTRRLVKVTIVAFQVIWALIVSIVGAIVQAVMAVTFVVESFFGLFSKGARESAASIKKDMGSLANYMKKVWSDIRSSMTEFVLAEHLEGQMKSFVERLRESLKLQQELYEAQKLAHKLTVDPVALQKVINKLDKDRNDLLTQRQKLMSASKTRTAGGGQTDEYKTWVEQLKKLDSEIKRVTLTGKEFRENLESLQGRWELQIKVALHGWEIGDPDALKEVRKQLEQELAQHLKSQKAISEGTKEWDSYQHEINRVQDAISQLTINIGKLKSAADEYYDTNKRIGETKAQFQERMDWIEAQGVALEDWTKDQIDEIHKLNAALEGVPVEIYLGKWADLTKASLASAEALAADVKALEDKNKRMTDGAALMEKHTSATDKYAAAEARLNKMLAEGRIDARTFGLELTELAKARDVTMGLGKPDMGKAIEGIQSAFGTVKMKVQFGGGAQSVAKQQLNTATQQLSSLKSIATNTGTMASTTGANSLGVQLTSAMNDVTFTVIGIDKQEDLLREGNDTRDSSLSQLKKINAGVAAMSSGGVLE